MSNQRRLLVGVWALAAILPSGRVEAVINDPGFSDATLVTSPDLTGATSFAWAPDGSNRLFVTRQMGEVRIVKDGALLPTPFATLSPLYTKSECGLLAVEFDPNFLVNKYVYFFVTVSASEQQIIRYRVDGDVGVEKTVLIDKLPTLGANHDGGALGFGPDGKLYWGVGDNAAGTPSNSDELTTLAAKIGRANRDGTPVADNPFADGAGPQNEYIFARGFRNPYTLTFQPATGLLWVNVVGERYEQAFIVRKGDHAGWTTTKYENNQPAGYITPAIRYRTNAFDTWALAAAAEGGAVRAGGSVTFKTATPHGIRVGDHITLMGVGDASFNTRLPVASVPSPTTFISPQAGPDATSGGGQAIIWYSGGSIVGGTFYDATAFPPAYRGNFIFADYNIGSMGRATFDPTTNAVTDFDQWGGGQGLLIDVNVGPDGNIYYIHQGLGSINRREWAPTSQGIVIAQTHLWMAEGEKRLTTVRLAQDPRATTNVMVMHESGDPDVTVAKGAVLTFTSANWNLPQPITFAAGRDLDGADEETSFTFRAGGIPAETLQVRVRDDNALALRAMAASTTVPEGGTTTVSVTLSEAPVLDVEVTARSLGGKLLVSEGGTLTFTYANWKEPHVIKVTAVEDDDGRDDTASLEVRASGVAPVVLTFTTDDDEPADAGAGPDLDAGALPDLDAQPDVVSSDAGSADAADARNGDAMTVASEDDGGCGCRVGGRQGGGAGGLALGLVLLTAAVRRRRVTAAQRGGRA